MPLPWGEPWGQPRGISPDGAGAAQDLSGGPQPPGASPRTQGVPLRVGRSPASLATLALCSWICTVTVSRMKLGGAGELRSSSACATQRSSSCMVPWNSVVTVSPSARRSCRHSRDADRDRRPQTPELDRVRTPGWAACPRPAHLPLLCLGVDALPLLLQDAQAVLGAAGPCRAAGAQQPLQAVPHGVVRLLLGLHLLAQLLPREPGVTAPCPCPKWDGEQNAPAVTGGLGRQGEEQRGSARLGRGGGREGSQHPSVERAEGGTPQGCLCSLGGAGSSPGEQRASLWWCLGGPTPAWRRRAAAPRAPATAAAP